MLDLCCSWVSHFPRELEERAIDSKKKGRDGRGVDGGGEAAGGKEGEGEGEEDKEARGEREGEGELEIIGLGLNQPELSANPILTTTILRDLNATPTLPPSLPHLNATVCVVSIDYLTNPLSVLSSLRERTVEGGKVHLVVSNRCFPTKAVAGWLGKSEGERLEMVGDYLWWSGWRGVEIVEVCDGKVKDGEGGLAGLRGMFGGGVDRLWVVRGVKVARGGGGEE